ncbi:hypothetical protein GALL_503220 [mine drainage metagenome]|uniref:Uncharacterized protein n=1 Tax=mine drainage metagenome TaxID=410659 RepID=A0A1J5PS29_9ZZZZ
MRRHRFLDQRGQWHAVERRAGRGELSDLGQNIAAALRLFPQRLDVARQLTVILQGPLQLAGNQENGRQRRAKLMGGRGGKTVKLGKMLFPRQHQLGRRQRIR